MKNPFVPTDPGYEEMWNERWPKLSLQEMSCPCCGEIFFNDDFMDKLHNARLSCGIPFRDLSGHRCKTHNAKVKGAEASEHLRLALDIEAENPHDRLNILKALDDQGLTTFGLAVTFIHTDPRPDRFWTYSKDSDDVWAEAFKEEISWVPKAFKLRRYRQQILGLQT